MLFKLIFNTLAGLFLVLALFGRNAPEEQAKAPVIEATRIAASPVVQAQPATIEPPSAPAAVITPLFVKSAPRPALAVSPEYLDATPAVATATSDIRTVTAGTLNVRARPSGSAARVDSVTRGEEVLVISEQDGWAKIRIEGDGIEGWVAAKFLK